MNIVVLCAGTSTEREVSIVSGKMVCKALRSKGHNARVLDVFFGTYKKDNVSSSNFFDGDYDLEQEVSIISSFNDEVLKMKADRKAFFGENVIEICQAADVVFMALHGANGEDGKVQAALDLFGVKYTGTGYLGSALAMDKGMTKHIFMSNGVPTPNGVKITKKTEDYVSAIKEAGIGYPCVVKPCCGGSSVGVSIPNNEEELKEAVEEAFELEDNIIVEEYVKGREFSIGVIAGEALPIIEIIPLHGFYDYKNKYQPGATKDVCPAQISDELTKKMQNAAVLASQVLQLDAYSRIDFLADKDDNIYCLEANTLPGMTPTSLLPQEAAAIGIEFPELCEKLINESLNK